MDERIGWELAICHQGLKRRARPALVVVLVRREICELLGMKMVGCRGGPRQAGLSSQTVSSGGQ